MESLLSRIKQPILQMNPALCSYTSGMKTGDSTGDGNSSLDPAIYLLRSRLRGSEKFEHPDNSASALFIKQGRPRQRHPTTSAHRQRARARAAEAGPQWRAVTKPEHRDGAWKKGDSQIQVATARESSPRWDRAGSQPGAFGRSTTEIGLRLRI